MSRPVFYFHHHVQPLGIQLVAGSVAVAGEATPAPRGEYYWRIIGDGHTILASGYASSPRGCLVSLRWSLASMVERGLTKAGSDIVTAIEAQNA